MTIAFLSDCRGHTVSAPKTVVEIKAKSAYKMNVEVGPKVTGHASSIQLLWLFRYYHDNTFYEAVDKEDPGILAHFFEFDIIRPTKAAAAYKALKASGSDTLIAPSYIVEVHDYIFWKNVYVTANTYGAIIKGFKEVQPNSVSIRY